MSGREKAELPAGRAASIRVLESYSAYHPPSGVRESVEDLLRRTPPQYTNGLAAVVLTDSASVTAARTRRVAGRKHRYRDCLGFYEPAAHGRGATLHLIVDNLLRDLPGWAQRVGLLRDLRVARTLYHEIGHHLDARIGSHSRSGERAAEDWSRRIGRLVIRAKYRRWRWPVLALGSVARVVLRHDRRRLRR